LEQTLHVVALLEDYATAPAAPHMRRSDIAKARRISQRMRASLGDLNPTQFSALNRERDPRSDRGRRYRRADRAGRPLPPASDRRDRRLRALLTDRALVGSRSD